MLGGAMNYTLGAAAMRLLEQQLVKTLPITSPVIGADFSLKVPGGVAWEMLAIHTRFTSDAIVANRASRIAILDSDGIERMRLPSNVQITANTTNTIDWVSGYPIGSTTSGIVAPLPYPPIPVFSSWTIASATSGIDPGDQWSQLSITIREWSPDQVVYELLEIMEDLKRQMTPETAAAGGM